MVPKLLSFQEIIEKFTRGENLFDITMEKWAGIKDSLVSLDELSDLGPIIRSARTGGAFCLEYQENCLICPLEQWCKDPQSTYQTIVKLMYMYAVSGQKGYKEQAIRQIERFLEEMHQYKEEFQRRLH